MLKLAQCGAMALALCAGTLVSGTALANDKPDFPPFDEVSKDFTEVTPSGGSSFFRLFVRNKDGQMLAELPQGYARQKHYIVTRLASGDLWAGYAGGTRYVYWKRYDDRMALMAPEISTRSTGDQESKDSVGRHFTDRVILDVPIVCMGPSGQPMIDMDALLVGQASKFFGNNARSLNTRLATIAHAKAFPENVEIAFEVPAAGGQLKTYHYSISNIKGTPGYQPREADERVGFFTTTYRDLGKYRDDEKWVRYINRWSLEKRDPSLKLSPPKQPIVYYLDHAVPVRYRRFVREGVEYWNKAYEKVGIVGAIEVRYQDKSTGAYMDKDPADVNNNFIMWLSNDIGTAIGPSRVHPETGEILDADIVLTDGWIRHFWYQFNEYMPDLAMEGYGPDTLAWLEKHPRWDPRVRMASPAQRETILAERAARGVQRFGGHPAGQADPLLIGDDEYDGLYGNVSQVNGMCHAGRHRSFDMAMMGMHLDMLGILDDDEAGCACTGEAECTCEGGDCACAGEEAQLIDGVPEWFVGPMLADLVAHEVGHTLGLRHNFKGSYLYSMEEINSPELKGKKAFATTVMDYLPVNINMDHGEIQGDYAMIDIGPYDFWAIQYGYTSDKGKLKDILARASEPALQFQTDEDTWGPDPYARRYDFASDPLEYAKGRLRLVDYHRDRILDDFVAEGESWAKARRGYSITLGTQVSSLGMMANWIGGAHVTRDKKGDSDRLPVEPVDPTAQREALEFVIENSFYDEAFGLTPDLLAHMTVDKWWDDGGFGSIFDDPAWPVHDRIMGIQASVLTMIMNPTTMQRTYDNEFRVPSDEDAFTVAELMTTVRDSAWNELDEMPDARFDERSPMISSLRRNLQREHIERLIDLAKPDAGSNAVFNTISNLATQQLRDLKGRIDNTLENANSNLDAYTHAHLEEASTRLEQVLNAEYIYNTNDMAGGNGFFPIFLKTPEGDE